MLHLDLFKTIKRVLKHAIWKKVSYSEYIYLIFPTLGDFRVFVKIL